MDIAKEQVFVFDVYRGGKAGRILGIIGTILLIGVVTGLIFVCIFAFYVKTCITPSLDLDLNDFTLNQSSIIYYKDANGHTRKELVITIATDTPLPKLITASANGCLLRGEDSVVTLKIPIYEEELKYFYSNYHDYYYLPTEDVALHKSVAGFVDREHRVPASAANCYTRKIANYLPQWDVVFEPFFKRDYKSRELFFELTDEMKKNRQAFSDYAAHVLAMMASTY